MVSDSIMDAVQLLTPYLEDTSHRLGEKTIYFDGWCRLAASVVLRAIVEDIPRAI